MPITVTERVTSRELSEDADGNKSLIRRFTILGTDNPTEGQAYLPPKQETWGDDGDLRVAGYRISVIKDASADDEAGVLEAEVTYTYKAKQPRDPNGGPGRQYQWDTTAQQEHIIRALSQEHFPAAYDGADAPRDIINETATGADGTEVLVPSCNYTETREMSSLPVDYLEILVGLTGSVNDATFRGWAARTVLFLGASASRRSGEYWQITYQFAMSPARSFDVTTANGIAAVEKDGHDYVWYSVVPSANAAHDKVETEIESVHVARLYEEGDFSQLGIGTEVID